MDGIPFLNHLQQSSILILGLGLLTRTLAQCRHGFMLSQWGILMHLVVGPRASESVSIRRGQLARTEHVVQDCEARGID